MLKYRQQFAEVKQQNERQATSLVQETTARKYLESKLSEKQSAHLYKQVKLSVLILLVKHKFPCFHSRY
jgi:hypothetical protein